MRPLRFASALCAALALLALAGPLAPLDAREPADQSAAEQNAAARLEQVAHNAAMLRVFLQAMPKGGDLHNHLSGTPAAEDYLSWAQREGYCADRESLTLLPPPCPEADTIAHIVSDSPFLYDKLVDFLSTRGWQQGVGANEVSGHTQFFIGFERFGAVAAHNTVPAMLVALRTAAGDHVNYLELMHNPAAMTRFIQAAPADALDASGLEARYAAEMRDLAPQIATARHELDSDEAATRAALQCDTPRAEAACLVTLRYLASGFRALTPSQAFRSLLFGFALADADPRFLGVNIVQPEDWPVSLRDYDLHMAMFRFLEAKYPKVHRTLHAGELAYGLVPPADMKNHIRKAIEAGAERIGHGTDIAYEDQAADTLRRMARDHIAVEVNLTSNAVILGVSGSRHPLRLYRAYGVPVALSTDDEGLLRSDMTGDYMRAVQEQGLGYRDLKQIARTSLEYSFLPGTSLWSQHTIGTPVSACTPTRTAKACQALLASSDKAREQARLERDFACFEASLESTPEGLPN